MFVINLLNQKGGVGKTTTALNLSAALTEQGYRVLMVDLDPQGHLTEACGVEEASEDHCLAKALVETSLHTLEYVGGLAVPWVPGVDLIPTNLGMFLTERDLYRQRAAEYRLQRLVELWAQTGRWDVVLVDCPPSLAILTDNALVAADQVIIPVQAEDSTMRALRLLMRQVEDVRSELRTEVDIMGMVVNQYDARKGTAVVSVYEALQKMAWPILATIGDRAAIREAWRAGRPVVTHAPNSDAAAAYRSLAKALMADTDDDLGVAE